MKKTTVWAALFFVLSISLTASAISYVGIAKGSIKGAVITYIDSDTITLTAGYGECNGNYWEITSPMTYDMNSLATGEDFHYIYIDANSIFPTPTIIDATTEPVWSNAKMGWYNNNDRCIGALWSPSGSATILKFCSNVSQKFLYDQDMKQILSNGNPNGSWQTVESSYITPVNAIAIHAYAGNTDTDDPLNCYVQLTCEDNNMHQIYAYGFHPRPNGWLEFCTGTSRDLKWRGADNDDNSFFIWVTGYQIDR